MGTRRDLLLGAFGCLSTQALSADEHLQPRPRLLPAKAKWAVYYGQVLPEQPFARYDVMVLDPRFQGDLEAIRAQGTILLGYLSLGELNNTQPAFARLPNRSMLLKENPNWPGSFTVDMRKQDWRDFVRFDMAPEVLNRGFDGFFLDTIDSSLALEKNEPGKFDGMHAAAVDLIQSLRNAYPEAPIMMNRGYPLLPAVGPSIDAVLAESLLGTYDFAAKVYQPVVADHTDEQMLQLEPARVSNPPLPIYSLDYWNPEDPAGIARLYAAERTLGHSPYVSTILLDSIANEPTV